MTRAALVALASAAVACGGPERADVVHLALSSDGRWLALAQEDGCVEVRALTGSSTRRTLRVGAGPPLRIALTEDGSRLAVIAGREVSIWSVATGARERTLGTGPGPVVTLKLSDAPEPFLLAAFDPLDPGDNLRIWRISDGVLIGSLSGSAQATFTFADEAVLLLSERDGAYEVQSFSGRSLRRTAFPRPLRTTAFAADGAFLAGVVADGTEDRVATMSVADDQFVWQSSAASVLTRQLLFLENPSRVVQIGRPVLVLDHESGRVIGSLPALEDVRLAVAMPDGSGVAGVRGNGTPVIVSSDGGQERALNGPAGCSP